MRKAKKPLTITISLSNQLEFLFSSLYLCFPNYTLEEFRSLFSPSRQFENIPAINFNFLELVSIQKMYSEGKVNKQKACNGGGELQSKKLPLLTFGNKGLGAATVFKWHRGT